MQRTSSLLVQYVGSTAFRSLPVTFQAATQAASSQIEEKYPKVERAIIQGSTPHLSHKDPSDDQKVITISYETANGTRVTSIHVHEDHTFNEFPSRNASKGK